ncbi:succinate dehydrogenase, cytochrome b556 subunit [Paucibacter sp. AS339]|uniref:succinate dehydrogenase, cytochrome b556 subunit n=1 Tax=Paucibacter hankyongi TaxID=3133434 RepID=UPI0030A7C217
MNRQPPARPVFFNLTQIQMPVGAITSIVHRVTGVVLALGLPYSLYVLHLSLDSAQSYERLTRIAGTGLFKVAMVAFIWILSHHLLAGARHLLMDIGIGSHLAEARRSAWGVNIGAAVMAVVAAGVVL